MPWKEGEAGGRSATANHTDMERKMAKIAMMALALTVVLAGCNTIAGAGQDVSAGGKAITNTAEQAK
jgi:predicted small secreted protein